MKIYFLRLHWHATSRSSEWFVDLLREFADVCPLEVDMDLGVCAEVVASKPDLVICWQTEGLAPWFLARGIPAIAVPMADSCSNMGNAYFRWTGQFGSISVSDFVARRFMDSGLPTFRMKYYPPLDTIRPLKEATQKNTKHRNRLFFGYRSEQHLEANALANALHHAYPGRFHVHNQIDEYLGMPREIVFDSTYFENIEELDQLLLDSDFFITPRNSEGIGFSTLRAISLGCVPVGVDGPGNCEYFSRPGQGIRIPLKEVGKFKVNPKRLVRNIRNFDISAGRKRLLAAFIKGREDFEEQAANTQTFIETLMQRFESLHGTYRLLNLPFRGLSAHNSFYGFPKTMGALNLRPLKYLGEKLFDSEQ